MPVLYSPDKEICNFTEYISMKDYKKLKNIYRRLCKIETKKEQIMFNSIERFFIKRILKKILKKLPFFKNKDVKIIEEKADELYTKIKETIIEFFKKHTN